MRSHPAKPVVVVVDDPSVRKALGRLLQTIGCRVESFDSTADFLSHAGARPPACVVLDLRVPGPSGLDVQRQLASERPDLPVVVMTSDGSAALRAQALVEGAVVVLDRPFDEQLLFDAVARAFERVG